MAMVRMPIQLPPKLKKELAATSRRLSKGKRRAQGRGFRVSEAAVVRLALEAYFLS